MHCNSRSKVALAVVLCAALLATGCSAQWISVALADLPVLTQMSLNIGTLVTTLQSGQQLTAAEAAAIQNISAEASKDMNLLEALYNDYKANPNSAVLQKIQTAISGINQNLPALLQAAHIGNAVLSARITAAVNLILTTVASFASLMPQTVTRPMAQKIVLKKAALPHPEDLKTAWNHQVCGLSGSAAFDSALSVCMVK